jgi:hypothetical protein
MIFILCFISNTDNNFALTLLSRYIREGLFGDKFTVKRASRELIGEVTKTTMTVCSIYKIKKEPPVQMMEKSNIIKHFRQVGSKLKTPFAY